MTNYTQEQIKLSEENLENFNDWVSSEDYVSVGNYWYKQEDIDTFLNDFETHQFLGKIAEIQEVGKWK